MDPGAVLGCMLTKGVMGARPSHVAARQRSITGRSSSMRWGQGEGRGKACRVISKEGASGCWRTGVGRGGGERDF